MEETAATQIPILATEVLDSFEAISSALHEAREDSGASLTDIELKDAIERYRSWSGNLGAIHPLEDRRSLAHRLRNSPEVQLRTVELLRELNELLRDATSPPILDQYESKFLPEDEALVLHLADFDTSQQCKDSWLSASIADTITRLFKLSALIAKASIRDRFAKAEIADLPELDGAYDIAHVRDKFPKCRATPWLLTRLGTAITKRRRTFMYCREHRSRIEEPRASSIIKESDTHPPAATVDRTLGDTAQNDRSERSRHSKPSVVQTTASTLPALTNIPFDDGCDDSRSFSTVASSLHSPEAQYRLHVPKLADVARLGEHFECPYCCTIRRFNGDMAWRRHVFADLRPYVCTHEDCGLLLFGDKSTWISHELEEHRRIWTCELCRCPPFEDSKGLQLHLQSVHSDMLLPGQLPSMIMAGSKVLESIPMDACPLCDWAASAKSSNGHAQATETVYATSRHFLKHIAEHLEQLALFALPRTTLYDAEDGHSGAALADSAGSSREMASNTTSSAASVSHQNDVSLPPPTPALFDAHYSVTEDDGVIVCICGYDDDDGNTIACDLCASWQHTGCFYPEYAGFDLPGELRHTCISCEPRAVDGMAARVYQASKREPPIVARRSIKSIIPNDIEDRPRRGAPQPLFGYNFGPLPESEDDPRFQMLTQVELAELESWLPISPSRSPPHFDRSRNPSPGSPSRQESDSVEGTLNQAPSLLASTRKSSEAISSRSGMEKSLSMSRMIGSTDHDRTSKYSLGQSTSPSERPFLCPVPTCEYHTKGFARKSDQRRHTLTHYIGSHICHLCPGLGTEAERRFSRADVFKRHLVTVHGATPRPAKNAIDTTGQAAVSGKRNGVCSTCGSNFSTAQQFYDHLDDCVLAVVNQGLTNDNDADTAQGDAKNSEMAARQDKPHDPIALAYSHSGSPSPTTTAFRNFRPHRNILTERLQAADSARSQPDDPTTSKGKSPFKEGSPLSPIHGQSETMQGGTSTHEKEQILNAVFSELSAGKAALGQGWQATLAISLRADLVTALVSALRPLGGSVAEMKDIGIRFESRVLSGAHSQEEYMQQVRDKLWQIHQKRRDLIGQPGLQVPDRAGMLSSADCPGQTALDDVHVQVTDPAMPETRETMASALDRFEAQDKAIQRMSKAAKTSYENAELL